MLGVVASTPHISKLELIWIVMLLASILPNAFSMAVRVLSYSFYEVELPSILWFVILLLVGAPNP